MTGGARRAASSRRRTRTIGSTRCAGSPTRCPGGVVDCSIGNPVDPIPEVALAALAAAAPASTVVPAVDRHAGAARGRGRLDRPPLRRAPRSRREVIACVGTKELVASLPHLLHLRDPSRDTVLYPGDLVPDLRDGRRARRACARCRSRSTTTGSSISARVSDADAERALLLWTNDPGNPTAAVAGGAATEAQVAWARARGRDRRGRRVLRGVHRRADAAGHRAARAAPTACSRCHSLSKRSNMAGLRVGFVAGDAGARPVPRRDPQARRADRPDADPGRGRGRARRRRARRRAARPLRAPPHADARRACAAHGLVHDGGPAPFYLWLRAAESADDGWEIAARLAEAGTLVAPGQPLRSGRRRPRAARAHPARRPPRARARAARRVVPPRVSPRHRSEEPAMSDVATSKQQINALWEHRDDLAAVMPEAEAAVHVRDGDRPARLRRGPGRRGRRRRDRRAPVAEAGDPAAVPAHAHERRWSSARSSSGTRSR